MHAVVVVALLIAPDAGSSCVWLCLYMAMACNASCADMLLRALWCVCWRGLAAHAVCACTTALQVPCLYS